MAVPVPQSASVSNYKICKDICSGCMALFGVALFDRICEMILSELNAYLSAGYEAR